MLRNINSLKGYTIHAADGELGTADEFYFDDKTWAIRYLVVKTGGWLSGRKVLISTAALKREPDLRARALPVNLTREQVRNSPDIDTGQTVTRLHELELHKHYAWAWVEGFYAGGMSGGAVFPLREEEVKKEARPPYPETRLQSTRAVTGYRLHAADGLIGHVEDYIVDDAKWVIRYLVAGTGTWLPGRKVLVSPHWIERVDWKTSEVFVALTRLAIEASPRFDPSQPVSEDYESELYDHYSRPGLEKAGEGAVAQRAGRGRF
ncbi:MAG TPA: hypothetical protein DEQ38_02590 [Elusimicrobia bacterium]|nr:MAG: hypothetical protein A2089_03390 [Elusimicrobia bacterium GWD2_63_28]HCC46995.1 hypothetical protein [Elusimicrobiota bacterium]